MKEDTQNKLINVIYWVAMITPPWNIFWWIVGTLYYFLSGAYKTDHSKDVALMVVLQAPVLLPPMPFMHFRDKAIQRKRKERQMRWRWAAMRIAYSLLGKGIKVRIVDIHWNGCMVIAHLLPKQEDSYREVYAKALKQYKDLSAGELCRNAAPIEPLNEEWAKNCGISEYAAEEFSAPCVLCGRQDRINGYMRGIEVYNTAWWGNRESHERLRHDDRETDILLADGKKERLFGYRCEECMKKYKWTRMSG